MNQRTMQGHGEPPQQGLTYGDVGVEPEDDGLCADVAAPATGTVRLCAHRFDTCTFHAGNLMDLQPGRVTDMVTRARRAEGHVVCHKTLGTDTRRSAEASPTAPTKAAASPCALPARSARCGRSPRHDYPPEHAAPGLPARWSGSSVSTPLTPALASGTRRPTVFTASPAPYADPLEATARWGFTVARPRHLRGPSGPACGRLTYERQLRFESLDAASEGRRRASDWWAGRRRGRPGRLIRGG